MKGSNNLIILGPQGSGKGTQGELLADKFGYVLIGAGDSLREIAKQDTELGRRVHQTINVEGRLVEPELVAEVFEARLSALPKEQGVIIEGFPRSLKQYELLHNFWPKLGRGDYQVILMELSEEEAVKRLLLRSRVDDTPEMIRERLALYNSETLPVIEALEAEGKIIRVNGAPSIEEIHADIVKQLNL
ncbi:MAG: nucleoside monophosphate kinase [Candidatus Doudnabacteria bacterium]|nr:nucleoside monophosphate kinase [Candidatus Doudnabacteria bacterium]